MKKVRLVLLAASVAVSSLPTAIPAQVILQPADGSTVAFEADIGLATLLNTTDATKVTWISTNDPSASGGTVLYCNTTNVPPYPNGINGAGGPQFGRPNSFVTYSINFSQAGTYTLYYRWRANAGVVAATGDNFQANSCFFPNVFGTFTTPGDVADYHTAAANGVGAPGSTAYQWTSEATTYTVGAPGVQILSIGDREWGFFLDRVAFSTNAALTAAQLDATPNAFASAIPGGFNDGYIAFEADRPVGAGATYLNTTDTTKVAWISTNDASASGGTSLYCNTTNAPPYPNGINGVGGPQFGRPNSFVTYNLVFNLAGTYTLYYRWRANAGVVAATGDNFQANSCFLPNNLGVFTTPGAGGDFHTASANGLGAPGSTIYQWSTETTTYSVGAPGAQVFSIGDREWGFFLDRIVLSTNAALTSAQLDALANSGGLATPPKIRQVTGAWGNQNVMVGFSDAVNPATISPTNFALSGGVAVTGSALSPGNASLVVLATTAQAPATAYTLTVNNVASAVTGLAIPSGSTANFTSWRLAAGWALQDVYYASGNGATGVTNISSYTNNIPDATYWVRGLQNNHFPDGSDYTARLTAIFTPTNTSTYSIYAVNDDDCFLMYSTNVSAAVLNSFDTVPDLIQLTGAGSSSTAGVNPSAVPPFFNNGGNMPGHTATLTAGTPYVIQGLQKQVVQDSYLKITVDPDSVATPPDQLSALSGNLISAWVNPDLGAITITQQPTNTTAATQSQVVFSVKATSAQSPIFYQWRSNGVDIVGAERPVYITPVLNSSYQGTVYSVVVGAAGRELASANATLTVVAGTPPAVVPVMGLNFAGGLFNAVPGELTSYDVAGVVPQAYWNNLFNNNFDGSPGTGGDLVDALGRTNGTTLVCAASGTYLTGAKAAGSANAALFEGYIHGSSNTVDLTLSGISNGTYNVLVYSCGFSFNASYEQSFSLTNSAGSSFPTYYGKAPTGPQYVASPLFVRMTSTTPGVWTPGNYAQFDRVNIGSGDILDIIVSPESPQAEGLAIPAICGIQIVQVLPALTITVSGTTATISWPYGAYGFVLESSPVVAPAPVWSVVGGAPNPITSAGSLSVSTAGPPRYFRLRK
jgi:hypothetical protein